MIDSPVLPALGGFAALAVLAFLQRKISKGGTPTEPVSPPPSPPEPGPSYSSPPDDPSDPEKYGGGPPPSDPPNSYHAKPPWPTRRALCWAIALFTLLLVVAITIAAVCGAGVCTAAPPSPPPPPPPTCPNDPTCSANTCNGKLFNEGLCCWDNTAMECTDDVCTTDGSSDEVLSLCLIGTPLATCFDGIANWVETDTDCGGGCTPCENHKRCAVNEDCDSAFCKIWVSPPSPPPPPPRGRLLEYSQEWLNKWNGTNKYDSPPGICQNKDFLEPDKPDEDWDKDNKGLLVSSLPPTWSYSEHGFSCVSQRGEWLWWQGDEEIPDADWLGCQILGSASIFARPLANGVLPSDPSRLKVAPIDPIPDEKKAQMVKDGCYRLNRYPIGTTEESVRTWSTTSEYSSAVSQSFSTENSVSGGFGPVSASAGVAVGKSSSNSARRETNNVGAVVERVVNALGAALANVGCSLSLVLVNKAVEDIAPA